jgi:hypothetical protein
MAGYGLWVVGCWARPVNENGKWYEYHQNQCESALLPSATNGTDRIITLRLSLSLSHISCLVEMV